MERANWKNREIYFDQETEFRDLKREILDGQIYYFETEEEKPIIVDAGAHIGLATIYFKWLYPGAEIIAFEPNQKLFRILEKNIETNELQDVTLVNAALGKHEGKAKFWIDATNWQWWSVGSMTHGAWNGEQKVQEEITVDSVKLSTFVQNLSHVDLLKMDVEGAEWTILRSLGSNLDKVRQIIFEFHPTPVQNLSEIMSFLEKRGYQVNLKDRKNRHVTSWHERELILVEAARL